MSSSWASRQTLHAEPQVVGRTAQLAQLKPSNPGGWPSQSADRETCRPPRRFMFHIPRPRLRWPRSASFWHRDQGHQGALLRAYQAVPARRMSAPPPPSVTASAEVVSSGCDRHGEHPGTGTRTRGSWPGIMQTWTRWPTTMQNHQTVAHDAGTVVSRLSGTGLSLIRRGLIRSPSHVIWSAERVFALSHCILRSLSYPSRSSSLWHLPRGHPARVCVR